MNVIIRLKNLFTYGVKMLRHSAQHRVKENTVKQYARRNGCNVFVETGTYWGEMDKHVYKTFDYLASVEIQKDIYEKNLISFKDYDKLHLYNGDSTVQIPIMLKDIKEAYKNRDYKILFWLDGHYSAGDTGKGEKDTPILEELRGIKESNIGECIILVDDARCFVHEGEYIDYPTIAFLKEYVHDLFGNSDFRVEKDIIRITIS